MDIDLAAPNLPSPALFLETAMAYRRTAALRAAMELDIFTALGTGPLDAAALAEQCHASPRGVRILCDSLATMRILQKDADRYALTMEASVFLSRLSPACIADAFQFLSAPFIQSSFAGLAAAVRRGGTPEKSGDVLAPEHDFWMGFARAMAPVMAFSAEMVAQRLNTARGERWNVLDIAAGHGMFGITIARHNPNATITALDWPNVLEVAAQNARAAGLADQYHTLPGSVFDVDFGKDYNLILVSNFLHHFDTITNEGLLRRIHRALVPGGRVAVLEFVPDEDRLAPDYSVFFAMNMLVHTQAGDAYTLSELDRMLESAGFSSIEAQPLLPGPQTLILATK